MEEVTPPPQWPLPERYSHWPFSWATLIALLGVLVALGLAQYLIPAKIEPAELRKELLKAKARSERMSALSVTTFQRNIGTTKGETKELYGPLGFEAGTPLVQSVPKNQEYPLSIPRPLYEKIWGERSGPVKLNAAEEKDLVEAGEWGKIAREDAAQSFPKPHTPNLPDERSATVIGLGVLAGLGLGFALLVTYVANLNTRAQPRLLPLPLAWQPQNDGEQHALVDRLILILLTGIVFGVMAGILAAIPLFFVLILEIRGYKIPWRRLFARPERNAVTVALGTYIGFMPLFLVGLLCTMLLSMVLPGGSHELTDTLARDPSAIRTAFISAVVIAPLAEEVLFRGILLPLFARAFGRIRWGIIASSAVFAMVHMQGPPSWPVLFLLAAATSVAYVQSRSLWAPILVHALHNALILSITIFST